MKKFKLRLRNFLTWSAFSYTHTLYFPPSTPLYMFSHLCYEKIWRLCRHIYTTVINYNVDVGSTTIESCLLTININIHIMQDMESEREKDDISSGCNIKLLFALWHLCLIDKDEDFKGDDDFFSSRINLNE